MKSSVQVPQDTSPTILCAQRFDADGPFTIYRVVLFVVNIVVCCQCGCLDSTKQKQPPSLLPMVYQTVSPQQLLRFRDAASRGQIGKGILYIDRCSDAKPILGRRFQFCVIGCDQGGPLRRVAAPSLLWRRDDYGCTNVDARLGLFRPS